ncbi:MAG: hypothetical protein ABH858_03235, partial [Candidatus Omnitrophota bacterium]
RQRVDVYTDNHACAEVYLFDWQPFFDPLTEEGKPYRKPVFDSLAKEGTVHRFTQEIVFGRSAYLFLKRLAVDVDILYMDGAQSVAAANIFSKKNPSCHDYERRPFEHTRIIWDITKGIDKPFDARALGTDVDRMMYHIGLDENVAGLFRQIFLLSSGKLDLSRAAAHLADMMICSEERFAQGIGGYFTAYAKAYNYFTVPRLVIGPSGKGWRVEFLKGVFTGDANYKSGPLLEKDKSNEANSSIKSTQNRVRSGNGQTGSSLADKIAQKGELSMVHLDWRLAVSASIQLTKTNAYPDGVHRGSGSSSAVFSIIGQERMDAIMDEAFLYGMYMWRDRMAALYLTKPDKFRGDLLTYMREGVIAQEEYDRFLSSMNRGDWIINDVIQVLQPRVVQKPIGLCKDVSWAIVVRLQQILGDRESNVIFARISGMVSVNGVSKDYVIAAAYSGREIEVFDRTIQQFCSERDRFYGSFEEYCGFAKFIPRKGVIGSLQAELSKRRASSSVNSNGEMFLVLPKPGCKQIVIGVFIRWGFDVVSHRHSGYIVVREETNTQRFSDVLPRGKVANYQAITEVEFDDFVRNQQCSSSVTLDIAADKENISEARGSSSAISEKEIEGFVYPKVYQEYIKPAVSIQAACVGGLEEIYAVIKELISDCRKRFKDHLYYEVAVIPALVKFTKGIAALTEADAVIKDQMDDFVRRFGYPLRFYQSGFISTGLKQAKDLDHLKELDSLVKEFIFASRELSGESENFELHLLPVLIEQLTDVSILKLILSACRRSNHYLVSIAEIILLRQRIEQVKKAGLKITEQLFVDFFQQIDPRGAYSRVPTTIAAKLFCKRKDLRDEAGFWDRFALSMDPWGQFDGFGVNEEVTLLTPSASTYEEFARYLDLVMSQCFQPGAVVRIQLTKGTIYNDKKEDFDKAKYLDIALHAAAFLPAEYPGLTIDEAEKIDKDAKRRKFSSISPVAEGAVIFRKIKTADNQVPLDFLINYLVVSEGIDRMRIAVGCESFEGVDVIVYRALNTPRERRDVLDTFINSLYAEIRSRLPFIIPDSFENASFAVALFDQEYNQGSFFLGNKSSDDEAFRATAKKVEELLGRSFVKSDIWRKDLVRYFYLIGSAYVSWVKVKRRMKPSRLDKELSNIYKTFIKKVKQLFTTKDKIDLTAAVWAGKWWSDIYWNLKDIQEHINSNYDFLHARCLEILEECAGAVQSVIEKQNDKKDSLPNFPVRSGKFISVEKHSCHSSRSSSSVRAKADSCEVIPDKLWIGDASVVEDINKIIRLGFGAVYDCVGVASNIFSGVGISYKRDPYVEP